MPTAKIEDGSHGKSCILNYSLVKRASLLPEIVLYDG